MIVLLSMFLPPKKDNRWHWAAQIGVRNAVSKLAGVYRPWELDSLKEAVHTFAKNNFKLYALEGDQFDMSRIKLGLPGRDDDIARYQMMLRNMGKCGISILCYNFMAGIGWFRNKTDLSERGGALTSAFCPEKLDRIPLKLTHDELWHNYEVFIKAVLPVAEKSGVKMCLHPDDPPVHELLGYPRIFNTVQGFDRMLKLTNSPNAGITLCSATFREMNADDLELYERWRTRIYFTHLRTNRPLASGGFAETFHDNGPVSLLERFKKLKELNYENILIRPDHAPTMHTEHNSNPGYAALGRLFAIGYFKGIMESLDIPFE